MAEQPGDALVLFGDAHELLGNVRAVGKQRELARQRFAAGGHVLWSLGLVMALGQLIGARLGARLVIRRGVRLIRPMIVLVSLAISLKLLLAEYQSLFN